MVSLESAERGGFSTQPPLARAIRSNRVVTPDGVRPAVVRIDSGGIASVESPGASVSSGVEDVQDLGDLVLMPGVIDPHVHVNDPGRAEWEGWDTATRAARAGGVTTLVDMPLNSIPATTSVAALAAKREAAAGRSHVNVEMWGGVVPGNVAELEPMAAAGARGFKCFLVPSGVDEFRHVGEADLREAMPVIARLGLPLLVHAELPGPIDRATAALSGADPRRYANYLASRPAEAEVEAVRLVLRLCDATRCRVHIVHLSAAEALPELREARRRGLPVTVETCPHYLCFADGEIPDGATEFKCAPPIRDRANRVRLWQALEAGDIDLIASDHSPCPPAMKLRDSGDFMAAWGGIASLELGLSVVWTLAAERGIGIERVAQWMCAAPARLAGLERKGVIAAGFDADLIAFDDRARWTVDPGALEQRHPITPYASRALTGRVVPMPLSISGRRSSPG